MERFTPQIRADLAQVYGVDLSEYLGQGRWRAVLELVEELPWASRFREAQLNDPEYADAIAEQQLFVDPDKPDDGPRISEFGPVEQKLTLLIEYTKALLMWTQKGAGVKSPKPIKPELTPKTLVSALVERKEQEVGYEIATQFGFSESDFFVR